MSRILLIVLFTSWSQCFSQSFLNGNFEINLESTCSWNMPNPAFSGSMSDCIAFGLGNEVDIQTSVCGYAETGCGNWFISIATSLVGSPDAVSLKLSAPLITGNTYTICYCEQEINYLDITEDSIQIGLSTSPTSFGTLIYTSFPTLDFWTKRTFSFVAPVNGNYVTVKNKGIARGWNFIDNFSFDCTFYHVDLGNDTTLCKGDTLSLNVDAFGDTYVWQDNSTDSTFLISESGIYWVEITDSCEIKRDTIIVDFKDCDPIIEMPNIFTPNNDGTNDLFRPIIFENINNASILIYNRWGQLMFENSDVQSGWNGEDCSEGTYFWIVRYFEINGQEKKLKGFVTLLK